MTLAPDVSTLLRQHGITAREQPIEHDGFSGARISTIEHGGDRYVLKRVSLASDWIMRGLDDSTCREAEFAASTVRGRLPSTVRTPYVGAARDGDGWAILSRGIMPYILAASGPLTPADATSVVDALAQMHAAFWNADLGGERVRWCGLQERVLFLSPGRGALLASEGIDFGVPAGWEAFGRVAAPRVREIIAHLHRDPTPLVRSMRALPPTLLHADAKLANMGLNGAVLWLFDWSDVTLGPVGLEIGHFMAINVARLPWTHDETLERYASSLRARLGATRFDAEAMWPRQRAVAAISAMMVLGWAKAAEAEVGARDEFDWWQREIVVAAETLGF